MIAGLGLLFVGGNVGGTGEHMASARRISAAERQAEALKLKKEGTSYREIARKLGYASHSGARKAVEKALTKIVKEPAESYLKLSLLRLDDMRKALWWKVMTGDVPSILAMLKIEEREAKLLGLDAPTKIDIEHRIRQIATEAGLDPDEAVQEAQRIIGGNRR